MSMIAPAARRVENNTAQQVNERIKGETLARIYFFSAHPEQIPRRLEELKEEWDIERCLETGSSCLSLIGLMMSFIHSRKWLALPCAVQGFFLQHALQGWCPPLPIFRVLGVRTATEIEIERHALRVLQQRREDPPAQKENAVTRGDPSAADTTSRSATPIGSSETTK